MARPRNHPKRSRVEPLAALALAGLAAWPLACSAPAPWPPVSVKALAGPPSAEKKPVPAAWDGPVERADAARRLALLQELNRVRAEHGLPALKPSPDLDRAAQAHAEDMLRRGYFAHESPEGLAAFDRVRRLAPGAIVLDVRENLHYLLAVPASPLDQRVRDACADWMDSPGHRENMLNASSEDAGFGSATRLKEDGGVEELTVQVFGAAAGWWEGSAPSGAVRAPAAWRARTRQPLEFFLFDDSEPGRSYPDPVRPGRYWVGGFPLGTIDGAGMVSLPPLASGRYALAARRPGKDEGWHETRRFDVVP